MQVPPRLIGIIALLWSVLDLASPAGIQASRPAAPTGTSDSMIHPVTPDKLLSLDKYLIRYLSRESSLSGVTGWIMLSDVPVGAAGREAWMPAGEARSKTLQRRAMIPMSLGGTCIGRFAFQLNSSQKRVKSQLFPVIT